MTYFTSRTRHAPSNRPQSSQASQRRSCKRGKSADTHTSDANVNIPSNDDSNLAKKVLKGSQDNSDVFVHSTEMSEGPESISAPVRPIGGTLNEWCVYIIHYSNIYGGSVGTNVTVKGVYNEIELKINVLNIEFRKATSPQYRKRTVGRQSSKLQKKYHLSDIPKFSRKKMVLKGLSILLKERRRCYATIDLIGILCLNSSRL